MFMDLPAWSALRCRHLQSVGTASQTFCFSPRVRCDRPHRPPWPTSSSAVCFLPLALGSYRSNWIRSQWRLAAGSVDLTPTTETEEELAVYSSITVIQTHTHWRNCLSADKMNCITKGIHLRLFFRMTYFSPSILVAPWSARSPTRSWRTLKDTCKPSASPPLSTALCFSLRSLSHMCHQIGANRTSVSLFLFLFYPKMKTPVALKDHNPHIYARKYSIAPLWIYEYVIVVRYLNWKYV